VVEAPALQLSQGSFPNHPHGIEASAASVSTQLCEPGLPEGGWGGKQQSSLLPMLFAKEFGME